MKEEGGSGPDFAADVRKGLSSDPKYLLSKHFYDAKGDELFQRIMGLEEYYPARAEERILRDRADELAEGLAHPDADRLNLIEFGAGDGSKTRHILRAFDQGGKGALRYIPNDISSHVLGELEWSLSKELPGLEVEPWVGDQSELMAQVKDRMEPPRAILFLGGNIGNFAPKEGKKLLRGFSEALDEGDRLLIGFDPIKHPQRILRAYNDRERVTEAFNLNHLERVNRELGGEFVPDRFIHYPIYDPMAAEARSYLISDRKQRVWIPGLDMTVHFHAWEPIFMERSRKFSLEGIEGLAERTGFRVEKHFWDPEGDFVDSLWVVS